MGLVTTWRDRTDKDMAEIAKRVRVSRLANKAKKVGTLIPQPCEACGAPACKSQMHHRDYDKPYDVTWLCPRCHGKEHKRLRSISQIRE